MLSSWLSAWRSLWRRPAFFAASLLILALGIAANTTVFTVVDATLLKPLPYPDSGRLVTVMEGSPKTGREGLLAPARIEDWNRMNRTLESFSGLYAENVTDTSGAEPERLAGRRVAPRYFQLFQAQPALGRYFTAQEERERTGKHSHQLWTLDAAVPSVTLGVGQPSGSRWKGLYHHRGCAGQLL
jgi:putative ABC transport system permease protein